MEIKNSAHFGASINCRGPYYADEGFGSALHLIDRALLIMV